jgi:hypothetical protein
VMIMLFSDGGLDSAWRNSRSNSHLIYLISASFDCSLSAATLTECTPGTLSAGFSDCADRTLGLAPNSCRLDINDTLARGRRTGVLHGPAGRHQGKDHGPVRGVVASTPHGSCGCPLTYLDCGTQAHSSTEASTGTLLLRATHWGSSAKARRICAARKQCNSFVRLRTSACVEFVARPARSHPYAGFTSKHT